MNQPLSRLMYAYSMLMLLAAIGVITVIGAKTAKLMITALLVAVICFLFGLMLRKRRDAWLHAMCIIIPLAAFFLFAFRANSNLLSLIGIVQHELDHYDAYNKCINLIFLIFMSSASMITFFIAAVLPRTEE